MGLTHIDLKILTASAVTAMLMLGAYGATAGQNSTAPTEVPVETSSDIKVPAGTYLLEPTHAHLQWSLLHMGLSHYTARFDKLDAEIVLDPADLSKSSVVVSIDPNSVNANFPDALYKSVHANSGYASWSEEIAKSPKYLNAGAFPTIDFKSTAVTQTGPRTADVTGDLTLLGVTKPVVLHARFNGELEKHPFMRRPAIGFAAQGTFKRTDFGLAKALPTTGVGDEVTIRFDSEFVQKAAPAAGAN